MFIKGMIECELLSFSLCVKFVLCTILMDSIYTLVAFIKQLLQYFNTFIVDIKYIMFVKITIVEATLSLFMAHFWYTCAIRIIWHPPPSLSFPPSSLPLPPSSLPLSLLPTCRLEFYGVELFTARDHHGVELGLGITGNGIGVFKNRTAITTFSW